MKRRRRHICINTFVILRLTDIGTEIQNAIKFRNSMAN